MVIRTMGKRTAASESDPRSIQPATADQHEPVETLQEPNNSQTPLEDRLPRIRWQRLGQESKPRELPDGLLKLAYLANACVDFVEAFHRGSHEFPLDQEGGLSFATTCFKDDFCKFVIVINEGLRLLPRFSRRLTVAAGGIVSVCGLHGTSAHEVAFEVANTVGINITGMPDFHIDSHHCSWIGDVHGQTMKLVLDKITEDNFEDVYPRMCKRITFVDPKELGRLKSLIHREYLLAKQAEDCESSGPNRDIEEQAEDCESSGPNRDIEEQAEDSKTDTEKKGETRLPDSPDVRDLCRHLQKELPKGRTMIEIAREFTGEILSEDRKAQNLLRQARRFNHLWKQSNK